MNATARRESLLNMSPSPLEYSLFWDDRAGYYFTNLRVWQIWFCQHSNIQRRAPSFYLQAEYRHELSNITHNLCSFCPCRCYLSKNGEKSSSDVVKLEGSPPVSSSIQKMEGALHLHHCNCSFPFSPPLLLLLYTHQPKFSSASIHYFALQHTFVYAASAFILLLCILTSPIRTYRYHAIHQICLADGFLPAPRCSSAVPMVDSRTGNEFPHTTSNGKPEYHRSKPCKWY